MTDLVSVSDVDQMLQSLVKPAPSVKCPIEKCAGRILREDIFADRDFPPFDRSMMDGFAISAKDISEHDSFKIVHCLAAGEPVPEISFQAGDCIEIMTGAIVPSFVDTVVPYEICEKIESPKTIRLLNPKEVEPGQFVHKRGSDESAGEQVLSAGSRIGAVESGIVTTCGYAKIAVSQQPKITLFSTGNEVVAIEETPEPYQIRSSNRYSLETALALASFHANHLGHLPDNPKVIENILKEAISNANVIILSGGISKGQHDYIPEILNTLATCQFHGVRQKPGKPMGVWKTDQGCIIFALPGNPVSCLVAVHRYVIPFLIKREGGCIPKPSQIQLAESFSFPKPLTCFLPVRISEEGLAIPMPAQNSGDFLTLAKTDGFIELEAERNTWNAQETKPFFPWMR